MDRSRFVRYVTCGARGLRSESSDACCFVRRVGHAGRWEFVAIGGPTASGPVGGADEIHRKSRAIGDLALASVAAPGAPAPPDGEGPDPDESADVLIELNMVYPGGLREVRACERR